MMAVSIPTWVAALGVVALLLVASSILGGLVGPTPTYKIADRNQLPPNDSDRFLEIVEALTDARLEIAQGISKSSPTETRSIRQRSRPFAAQRRVSILKPTSSRRGEIARQVCAGYG